MPEDDNKPDDKLVFSFLVAEEAVKQPVYTEFRAAYDGIYSDLKNLNVYRGGGVGQTAGYVFEDMHAADFNSKSLLRGRKEIMHVLNNNDQFVDMIVKDDDGNVLKKIQAKCGYENTSKKIFEKYADETIVIDKGNKELGNRLIKNGFDVEESSISKKKVVNYVKHGRKEAELRRVINNKFGTHFDETRAPVVSKLNIAKEQLKELNCVALNSAISSCFFVGGVCFAKNMYKYMEGEETVGEVISETTKESLKGLVKGYLSGAVGYSIINPITGLLIETSVGGAINSALVSMAGITAIMPITSLPVFLSGMIIGAGRSMLKKINTDIKKMKYDRERYFQQLGNANKILDSALAAIRSTYDELDEQIKRTYSLWDSKIQNGYLGMHDAILSNDFERFSLSLDNILSLYDENVLFSDVQEFKEWFFDEESVLVL